MSYVTPTVERGDEGFRVVRHMGPDGEHLFMEIFWVHSIETTFTQGLPNLGHYTYNIVMRDGSKENTVKHIKHIRGLL
jgi:hypothetical protein